MPSIYVYTNDHGNTKSVDDKLNSCCLALSLQMCLSGGRKS